jgi:alkylated DNA repair dioxygenase AlkB
VAGDRRHGGIDRGHVPALSVAPQGQERHRRGKDGARCLTTQADLFARPLLGGLSHVDNLIDEQQEAALIDAIGTVEVEPFRFQGWIGKRLTASFGWHYDFDNAGFGEAAPIPDWLLDLRSAAAGFALLDPEALVQVLVTRYDPGAGIGWHRDRPVFEHVVGISLGAPATLRLRRRVEGGFERYALPLTTRSAYHLSGEARHGWEHSIAPIEATRWSITFRSLSDKGRIAGRVTPR